MDEPLGTLEIQCDAPAYSIVRSSRGIGIISPEDVPWLRLSDFHRQPASRRGVIRFLREFMHRSQTDPGRAEHCGCGLPLPEIGLAIVSLKNGDEEAYFIGQCPRCRTVYWDEP